ncbi:hypothetical protein [Streptomyces sp. NPDC046942]|uniref:hypothetical protein n=1 Tax=Streptomyces sp. NPDC046942 TaxID=3155137 RepID=UPI00340D3811
MQLDQVPQVNARRAIVARTRHTERGGNMDRRARRIRHSAVRIRNLGAASLALSAAFALSACGSSGGDGKASGKPSAPVSSPTATASADITAAEKEAVLKAYGSMWVEQVKAYKNADLQGTYLDAYAAGLALASVKTDLRDLKSKGIVATGEPSHKVDVPDINLIDKTPKAKLTDCLDVSKWTLIYRTSGKPVATPANRLTRYMNKIEAEKWGKQWKILDVTPEQQAC